MPSAGRCVKAECLVSESGWRGGGQYYRGVGTGNYKRGHITLFSNVVNCHNYYKDYLDYLDYEYHWTYPLSGAVQQYCKNEGQ